MTRHLRPDQITVDPDIRPRAYVSDQMAIRYAEAMTDGDTFPPLLVMEETLPRTFRLVDGYLRLSAAEMTGAETVPVTVELGDRRDALLRSCAVNSTHGYRRTSKDKRRAVLKLLSDEEWVQWSDREVARACRVSPGLVCAVRADLGICSNEQIEPADEKRRFKRGGQEHEMRLPQSKDRPRHEPERWALVNLYDDVDNLYDHIIAAGVEPAALLEHLNPEREARLRARLFECVKWLHAMDDLLGDRALEAS